MASGEEGSLDELLALVKEVCSKDRVQRLLRTVKQADGEKTRVRVSGKLDVIIDQHLRDAIQTGKLAKESVYELIGESEESGKQHIFYFVPKDHPQGRL